MDHEAAPHAGEDARNTVAEVIAALQRRYGFAAFCDIVIATPTPDGMVEARLDHVIVDQHGVLVVETVGCRGAVVRGAQADYTWVATRPDHANEAIQNPLLASDAHTGLMRGALENAGWPFAADEVRSLIVFVGAESLQIELDPAAASRVADIDHLASWYSERNSFAVSTPLSPEAVAGLAAAVSALRRTTALPAARRAADSAPVHASAPLTPISDNWLSRRNRAAALLVFLAVGLALLGYTKLAEQTAEPSAFVPVSATPTPTPAPTAAPDTGVPGSPPAAVEDVKPAKVDIALAKRRLKAKDPSAYNALSDPDSPVVSQVVDGQVTYEWEYMRRSSSNAIEVGKISITLDSGGLVVGQ